MFPCIHNSDSHISGWHSVQKVCNDAQVQQQHKMTATSMRHRASTLYASMDVPESERVLFYKHMGHSALINANIYQTPLAVEEVRKVGRRLQQMDSQRYTCMYMHHAINKFVFIFLHLVTNLAGLYFVPTSRYVNA